MEVKIRRGKKVKSKNIELEKTEAQELQKVDDSELEGVAGGENHFQGYPDDTYDVYLDCAGCGQEMWIGCYDRDDWGVFKGTVTCDVCKTKTPFRWNCSFSLFFY